MLLSFLVFIRNWIGDIFNRAGFFLQLLFGVAKLAS